MRCTAFNPRTNDFQLSLRLLYAASSKSLIQTAVSFWNTNIHSSVTEKYCVRPQQWPSTLHPTDVRKSRWLHLHPRCKLAALPRGAWEDSSHFAATASTCRTHAPLSSHRQSRRMKHHLTLPSRAPQHSLQRSSLRQEDLNPLYPRLIKRSSPQSRTRKPKSRPCITTNSSAFVKESKASNSASKRRPPSFKPSTASTCNTKNG